MLTNNPVAGLHRLSFWTHDESDADAVADFKNRRAELAETILYVCQVVGNPAAACLLDLIKTSIQGSDAVGFEGALYCVASAAPSFSTTDSNVPFLLEHAASAINFGNPRITAAGLLVFGSSSELLKDHFSQVCMHLFPIRSRKTLFSFPKTKITMLFFYSFLLHCKLLCKGYAPAIRI